MSIAVQLPSQRRGMANALARTVSCFIEVELQKGSG
jgi:hypothetical protein